MIKIIDLLNMVYEGKAPKKILYKYCEYKFDKEYQDYKNEDDLMLFTSLFENEIDALFKEVEIIEEDEKPEEIEHIDYDTKDIYGDLPAYRYMQLNLTNKVNEIIDLVNYLLKKEDNK